MSLAPHDQKKYRPDIDGLRAIAILSVVFYHAGFTWFPGGFVGVDVFFVISGYLITALLFDEACARGTISLSAFYARRVRRLMPAGLVVVAVTLLLGGLFMPPASDEQRALARSAAAVAFFASNFFFFGKTGGYFDAPSYNLPLLHTWSLSIEEQYYLLWPLLMVLIFRFSRLRGEVAVMRARVQWVLAVMAALSLIVCIATTPRHANFAFYLLPARIWEFAIGGIIGLSSAATLARARPWAGPLALFGLAMIIGSVLGLNHRTAFPGWAAIAPVLGTAALIVGMTANEHGRIRQVLASRPMVWIGLMSYSWYLWHWPLLSIYRIHSLGVENLVHNALLVALALGLAWCSFKWIERPIRLHRPWLFARVRTTLMAGAAISLLTLLCAAGLWAWQNHQKSVATQTADSPPYQKRCSVSRTQPVSELPRDKCSIGPDNAHPKVLLWGDSHAAHIMPMLMAAYPEVAVYQLTMFSCIPVIGFESASPDTPEFCADFNQRVLREITDLKQQGLQSVVISARWPFYLPKDIATSATGQAIRERFQSSLSAQLDILERAGLRVLVIAPTPEMAVSAPQCVALGRGSECNLPRATSEAALRDAQSALTKVIQRHPGVRLAQTLDFFCDTQICYAARDRKALYFDNDHLTATTSRALGQFLAADLVWLRGPGDQR